MRAGKHQKLIRLLCVCVCVWVRFGQLHAELEPRIFDEKKGSA